MKVVVDLGCATRSGVSSISTLVRKFRPVHLYGFDPSPILDESKDRVWNVPVTLRRKAAWLYDGTVSFYEAGSGSRVDRGGHQVECFDFSRWLARLDEIHPGSEKIVKMDIEYAETPLLEKMADDGTDKHIGLLLVEWHGRENEDLEKRLACPVRRWWL